MESTVDVNFRVAVYFVLVLIVCKSIFEISEEVQKNSLPEFLMVVSKVRGYW